MSNLQTGIRAARAQARFGSLIFLFFSTVNGADGVGRGRGYDSLLWGPPSPHDRGHKPKTRDFLRLLMSISRACFALFEASICRSWRPDRS